MKYAVVVEHEDGNTIKLCENHSKMIKYSNVAIALGHGVTIYELDNDSGLYHEIYSAQMREV